MHHISAHQEQKKTPQGHMHMSSQWWHVGTCYRRGDKAHQLAEGAQVALAEGVLADDAVQRGLRVLVQRLLHALHLHSVDQL